VRTVSVRADGTIVADQASRITPQRTAPPPLAVNAYANQPAEEPEVPAQGGQARAPQGQGANQQPWSIVEPPRPPTRTAARSNTPVEAGGFVVQVNSQKTEAEAQAAWRQMQSRFPTVLGSRQANIRRVDLGDRGVFYRAMLGPFASRDAASEVCQSLKTAGGDCIVQRN
jgi:cell division septation protein DedD